jgi:peptidoglycan/xylan/chitin deacetylase (PgdA/CDA1 family)
MAEFNLKVIKISFLVVMAMLVLAMASGMNILREEKFIDWKKIKMESDFLRYKRALAAQSSADMLLPSVGAESDSSIPVLLYHGIITGKDWKEDGTNITLDEFKNQMFALKKAGYQTITMADFYDYMKNGKNLPEKSIMITFDDGRRDSYYGGDPVLKAVGYNAVMFLISGRSLGEQSAGDNFYLGKSELQDMIASKRWEIQSHGDFDHNWEKVDSDGTKGHFMSNQLWLDSENRLETPDEAKKRILEDLASSKKKIENELGQNVVAYAYPFNDYGQESVNFPNSQQFIRDNVGKIYPLTFMQVDSDDVVGNYPDPNALYAKRIDVDSSISSDGLLDILGQNKEKKMPYSDSFWKNQGWKSSWGGTKVWGDLALLETEAGGGNMTTLHGTSFWKNYIMQSQVQINSGESVSQVVRYKNDGNYAQCSFGKTGISVFQKIDGKEYTLAEKQGNFDFQPDSSMVLGTEIVGSDIKCYLNGNLELAAQISQDLDSGGIGFSIWDDLPENASVSVKKVDVSAL